MMKKILLTAIGAALISTAFAQKTVTPDAGQYLNGWHSIPKDLTYNNKSFLEFGNVEYYNSKQIDIYDENIDLVKSIKFDQERTFNYTLAYTVQTREAKANKTKEDTSFVYTQCVIKM